MESAPWLMVFPGLAIFLTVVIFNLLGDSLRDILDPREDEAQPHSKSKKRGDKMKRLKQVSTKLPPFWLERCCSPVYSPAVAALRPRNRRSRLT